jgi:hypothetical protein
LWEPPAGWKYKPLWENAKEFPCRSSGQKAQLHRALNNLRERRKSGSRSSSDQEINVPVRRPDPPFECSWITVFKIAKIAEKYQFKFQIPPTLLVCSVDPKRTDFMWTDVVTGIVRVKNLNSAGTIDQAEFDDLARTYMQPLHYNAGKES